MTILNTSLLFAILFVATIRCYTITNEDPVLPSQKLLDDNSLLRILPNHETKIITCPSGTYLDKTSLTCQFESVEKAVPISDVVVSELSKDSHSNPENCRTFFLIGAAGRFIQDCPGNLLFNEISGNCDWPMQAGCCEYKEKNSTQIVRNI